MGLEWSDHRSGAPGPGAPPAGRHRIAGRSRVRMGHGRMLWRLVWPQWPEWLRWSWSGWPRTGYKPERSGTGSASCLQGLQHAATACSQCPESRSRTCAKPSASAAAARPPATSVRTGPSGPLRGECRGEVKRDHPAAAAPGPPSLSDPESPASSVSLIGKTRMNFCEHSMT